MQIFLKPLGSQNRPAGAGYTIITDNQIGFSKKPSRISKNDILICHGVKVGKVLGVCKVLDEATRRPAAFDGDRWEWKLTTSCMSEQYSSHWWDYDIRTLDLEAEYNRTKKEGEHITMAGDTIKGFCSVGMAKLRESLHSLL